MNFNDSFFTDRIKMFAAPTSYENELDHLLDMCRDILYYNKFSERFDQNAFERGVVDSCISRLESGRALSPAQLDQVKKMSRRKGPVLFCGHRK